MRKLPFQIKFQGKQANEGLGWGEKWQMCSYVLVTFRLSKVLTMIPRCFIYEVFILNIFFISFHVVQTKAIVMWLWRHHLSIAWNFSCILHAVILQSDDHRNTVFMSFLAKLLITYWLNQLLYICWSEARNADTLKFAHLNSFADWNDRISPPLVWITFVVVIKFLKSDALCRLLEAWWWWCWWK